MHCRSSHASAPGPKSGYKKRVSQKNGPDFYSVPELNEQFADWMKKLAEHPVNRPSKRYACTAMVVWDESFAADQLERMMRRKSPRMIVEESVRQVVQSGVKIDQVFYDEMKLSVSETDLAIAECKANKTHMKSTDQEGYCDSCHYLDPGYDEAP